MKHYDKEIYKQEKNFEMIIIIICIFVIRFFDRLRMYRLCGKK